tara:strand:- start:720 stop:974 length:255 start_codon:yes stop_codon:yes gene_type:complete
MVKLKGAEVALSSANNVGSANAVRVYNNTASDSLLTVAATAGTSEYAGTVTLRTGQTITITKQPLDTIASGTGTMRAVAVAFHY